MENGSEAIQIATLAHKTDSDLTSKKILLMLPPMVAHNIVVYFSGSFLSLLLAIILKSLLKI